jgi:hypothetical protein
MRKNIFRNVGLVLAMAVLLAAPLKSFADDPIVGSGSPDPGPGGTADAIVLVLALATA